MIDIENIVRLAKERINAVRDLRSLEEIKAQFLGKSSELTQALKSVGQLKEEERPKFGQIVNQAKEQIQNWLHDRSVSLQKLAIEETLQMKPIDITLPGRGYDVGIVHPVSLVLDRLVNILWSAGFVVEDGPEIENEYYNFDALNMPKYHPARSMHDTFYITDNLSLRSHTSTVQIRCMEQNKPPIYMIAPGRVYRRDFDATHSPMFHQIEGLVIDKGITFANLKSIVFELFKVFFNDPALQARFRPSYFPYTQPSAEFDIWSPSSYRWLEMGGCGMVHPNVLRISGIDPEIYQGYAFGFGIERLTMIYYQINDIRVFFENDLRALTQFI
jgi:phenylalanyl-tRNA synthetase alpha chain